MVVEDPNAVALKVGGAQFIIKGTSPIDYETADGSAAYGDTLVANHTNNEYAFANANGSSTVGADGANVITLTYKVPDDCAAGRYPVTISDLFVSDENGNDITSSIITYNGAIIIEAPTTTTTTTTTTVATTTASGETTTAGSTTTVDPNADNIGDVNLDGIVDIADAVTLNKYLAGVVQLSDQALRNANCDQSPSDIDNVGDKDTTALVRFVLNMEGYQDLPFIAAE